MITQYVRLTFKPAGSRRKRTIWAEVVPLKSGSRRMFWVVDIHGERPEPNQLVILHAAEGETKTAVMSRKYCTLMLLDNPELQNEVDADWVRSTFQLTTPDNPGTVGK